MTLIGMPEAGRRLGVSSRSAKRALREAGISLYVINERALAIEESDLAAFIAQRAEAGYTGRGRPPGSKNKPKPTMTFDNALQEPEASDQN